MESASENVDGSAIDVSGVDAAGLSRDLGEVQSFLFKNTSVLLSSETISFNTAAKVQIINYNDNKGNAVACDATAEIFRNDENNVQQTYVVRTKPDFDLVVKSIIGEDSFTVPNSKLVVKHSGSRTEFKPKDGKGPFGKGKDMDTKWNGQPFTGEELSRITKADPEKARKYGVLRQASEKGIFSKCQDAQVLLDMADAYISQIMELVD